MTHSNDDREVSGRRGSLDPLWLKLHGHERDIRELYRYSAQAYERISATTEVLADLRVDVKGVQEQIHSDHKAVLVALGEVKAAQATANGGWRIVKWGISLMIATASTALAGLGLMYKSGLAG